MDSRWTRRGLLLGGAALGLSACGQRAGSRNFSRSDSATLNRGNGAEPDTIDPHKASGNWENNIIGDMFIGLMTDAADGSATEGAAESFTASPDGLTYTFKLREHSWSDGMPVTAHDFVYSYRRMADPRTAAQYVSILYPIRNMAAAAAGKMRPEDVGARAIDDRTLELSFEYQVPYIRELLTHYASFAVPQHVVEKHGESWTHAGIMVSNGPYVLKEWLSNDHILLVRNPRFFDAANVRIERVYYYPTPDASAALKRFRAGEFDLVTDSVPPQQINWLRQYMPHDLRLSPYILTQYVQFNMRRKPFDDRRVREALSLAIDREIMAEKVMRAGELPAYSLVPGGLPGYSSAELAFRRQSMSGRLARAKALLAEAGYSPQKPLTFDVNCSNVTETRQMSVALQGMWSAIGVQARLMPYDTPIHYDMLRKHDFDVTIAGWIADYRDAKNYLMLFETATTDLNYGLYSNPAFDALVAASDNERDPGARQALLRRSEQVLLDDAAVAPVYFGVTRNLCSPQVKGFVSNNVNIHRSRFMSLDRSDRTA